MADQPKKGGRGPPPTQDQVDKANEEELSYLLRRYRIDQEDTLKYKGAVNTIMNKQIEVINSLYAVKEEVMVEVSVAKNDANDVKDNNVFTELTRLLKHGDHIDHQIKYRRKCIKELVTEIRKSEKIRHAAASASNVPTDHILALKTVRNQRRVGIMENRLYNANVKFNVIVAECRAKREQLEDMIKYRASFNLAFQKMIKLLVQGKTIMIDLVEMTKVAYEHREEAQERVNMVGKHGSNNKETRAVMMADLTKQTDHYNNLKDFVSSKGQKRINRELQEKQTERNAARRRKNQEVIDEYTELLQNILSLGKVPQLDNVVTSIATEQMENFTRYLRTMNLHDGTERMKLVVAACREGIFEEKKAEAAGRVQARNEKLGRLRRECEERQQEVDKAYDGMQANRQHLDDLLIGVEALFDLTEVDKAPLLRKLGDNEIPNEHNAFTYMEVVERFTVDLLAKVAYLEKTHSLEELPLKTRVIRAGVGKKPIATLELIDPQEPCAICAETSELSNFDLDFLLPVVVDNVDIQRQLRANRADADKYRHSLAACPLPRSKKIESRARNSP